MGGRGKSSANAYQRGGGPQNFADPGVITLEQLEAQAPKAKEPQRRFEHMSTEQIAQHVAALVRDMLAANKSDYEQRHDAMARVLAEAALEVKRRPEAERLAFSTTLAPLFEQLREQAGGES